MKKFLLTNLLVISAGVYGASIDHIQTYSPDYLSNQAQTGMINAVSGNYNPAGTTRLEKGKYIHAGLQYAFGKETMSYNGKDHSADLRQPVPNIAFISVDDRGAWFANFGGIAGGGELKYNGVPGINVAIEKFSLITTPVGKLQLKDNGTVFKGSNKYSQLTLGRSFNVNDKLSVSVAGRIAHGTREIKGNINVATDNPILKRFPSETLEGSINSKRQAWGYGLQLGINYKVNDKLNLAARYDSRIKMNFKAKGSQTQLQTTGVLGTNIGFTSFYPQYAPGTKTRRDLPAILAIGASYKVTDRWTISTAANYYFNKDAKMDRVKDAFGGSHGVDYDNGWEVALGNEYQLNDKFTLIGSINYAKTGAKDSSYSDVEYALDSTTLGLGLRYKYDETLDITTSFAHFFYNTSEGTYKDKYAGIAKENQKYKKSISAFGVSITKKF